MSKNNFPPVIRVEGLTKYYGKTIGIDGLSFSVNSGEVFGFLGPNGAGKTTTISLFLDLIRPTRGSVYLFGLNPREHGLKIRSRIGYLPGEMGYYENMTGMQYLNYFASLRRVDCTKRIKELAEYFFCMDINRKIKTYSRGMKQLTGIIQAFMSSPELYILDEPTANLDPIMCQRFYRLVEEEARKGKTIFLSSHQLHEVERLCGRICIIKKGKMATLETVDNIRKNMKKTIEISFNEDVAPESLKVEGVTNVTKTDGLYCLEITGDLNKIFARLSTLSIKTFDFRKASLGEIFHGYFEE